MDQLCLGGRFSVEHWYNGELLGVHLCHNDTTNEGKNRFIDIGWNGVPKITTWYLSIIDNTGYSALAATDIYRNINLAATAWKEYTTYTDTNNGDSATTRPVWVTNAASNKITTNTTKAVFTCTAVGIIKGLFVVGGSPNAQIKGDHTGDNSILWATALFSAGNIPVFIGSVLRVVYAVNA
jgi:hypothetical protein